MEEKQQEEIAGTIEGHILLIAIALVMLYLAILTIGYQISPATSNRLVAITVANVIFGRAAGMSLGYAAGYGHLLVIPLNMFIESVLVLLFYPMFVFSCRHLISIRWLTDFVERTREAAERKSHLVRRFGLIGLFIFVWFPFSMTGPLMGCVLGYLMGLRTKVNLTVVLMGTYTAIVGWGVLLRGMLERLAGYSTYAPITIVTTIMALLVIIHVYRTVKQKR